MTKKLIVNLILISLFIIIASSAATFEFKMDFNDEEVDYDARNIIDLTDFWQVTLAGSGPVAKVVEDGDNKYLYLEGYSEIYTIDMIEPPYTFSLDVQVIDTEFVAFFVRAHYNNKKHNPAHHDGRNDRIGYFELDRYKQNGGENCASSTRQQWYYGNAKSRCIKSSDKNLRTGRY